MARTKRVPAPATVTQFDLQRFRKLQAAERELAVLKSDLRERLAAGATVEAGKLAVTLVPSERRMVDWQAVYRRDVGEAKADRIMAATRPTPIAPSIRITEAS